MNARLVFVLLALCALAFGQREAKQTLDSFASTTGPLVILIQGNLPTTLEASTTDASVIGGERDLSLTAESGDNNLVLTSSVTAGLWSVATPNSARGFALMQYDGVDGSIGLRPSGLGGVSLTADGGDSFRLLIQSDIDTLYDFTIYSGSGATSSLQITIPGDDTTNEYILDFADFQGNADFNNVGAIEILIEAFDNVDTFVEFFGTTGPVIEPSVTPTPAPSGSSIPPPGGFTWYTFDDDDNGRSPCADEEPRRTYFVEDGNIIYYYFYGFDPIYESSDASVLAVSVFITAIFALFM